MAFAGHVMLHSIAEIVNLHTVSSSSSSAFSSSSVPMLERCCLDVRALADPGGQSSHGHHPVCQWDLAPIKPAKIFTWADEH